MGALRRHGVFLSALSLALLVTLVAARTAPAEVVGAGYTLAPLIDTAGNGLGCDEVWSGGSDAQGYSYIPCRSHIVKLDMLGRPVEIIPTPAGLPAWRDVAPTFDGQVIYYVAGIGDADTPNPATHPGRGSVVKLVKTAGTWTQDPTFRSGPYPIGAQYWAARNVAVDLAGNVYATVNQYVYILDPATGARSGAFGGDMYSDANGYVHGLDVVQGIAVNSAGTAVYVVEQNFNNIQRYDKDANGAWIRNPGWRIGNNYNDANPNPGGCNTPDYLSSPYDVAIDGAGGIYVLDTSCRRIMKFDIDTRQFLGNVWYAYGDAPANGNLYHGLAGDFKGNLTVAQHQRRYVAPTPLAPICRPDSDLPTGTITGLVAQGWKTSVPIRLDARDGCSQIAKVLLSGNIVGHHVWEAPPANGNLTVTFTPGEGTKTLSLQVQDTYGRLSTPTSVSTNYSISYWVPVARSGVRIYAQQRYCRNKPNPLSSVQSAKKYRLLTRCATYTGKVLTSVRRGKLSFIQLQLPLSTTRALYAADAPRAVTIWVIGPTTTRQHRKIKKGRSLTVTSALIVDRKTRGEITGIPAYRLLPR